MKKRRCVAKACFVAVACVAFGAFRGMPDLAFATSGRSEMNVVHHDKRLAGAESWFVGFMGGRPDMLMKHGAVLGAERRGKILYDAAWLFRAAYPGTVFGWSGAVVKSLDVRGAETVVSLTKIETPKFGTSGLRCVEEWGFVPDMSKTRPVQVERTLRISPDGILDMPQEAFDAFIASIRRDVKEGLRWVAENPRAAVSNGRLALHILGIDAENSVSSTVKLPQDIGEAWNKAANALKGVSGK